MTDNFPGLPGETAWTAFCKEAYNGDAGEFKTIDHKAKEAWAKAEDAALRLGAALMFRSLYRCSDAMRIAPSDLTMRSYEEIFRTMLIVWAAENELKPELDRLSYNDQELYKRLAK